MTLERATLTVFQGRAGDRNDLAIAGAAAIGALLSQRLGLKPTTIGTPEPALGTDWAVELGAATQALQAMAAHYATIFEQGLAPLTVLNRCAVALATLPAVARSRPDSKVVWFDAHADLNTPRTTTTGYLGGLALAGAVGLWDSGLGNALQLENVILAGVRDIDPPEQALIRDAGIHLIPPHNSFVDELKAAIAGSPVYIHLDCDVLNPGLVPTEYQHEGGLTLSDLHAACEAMAENGVVGLEVAEFQNAWKPDGDPASPGPLLDALQPAIDALTRKS